MKEIIKNALNKMPYIRTLHNQNEILRANIGASEMHYGIYEMFKGYSMTPIDIYVQNLLLAEKYKHVEGVIVECGTWRGGMIGGIAKLLNQPNRTYYLYDSFEGLPEATELDGKQAQSFATDEAMIEKYDNCKAEIEFAQKAMQIAKVQKPIITKGWFNETLSTFPKDEKIAILRLDGDWYESTLECLTALFDNVVEGGVIIIDDYYAWEGCAKAVHDFLSSRKSDMRIRQFQNMLCYIHKDSAKYW
jgi:O-methyltransferase